MSKHERARGTRTDEENRRNKEVLKQETEALEGIYGSTAEIQRILWTNQEEIIQLRIRNHRDSVQPFINEDIRDCFFDYEQEVLLRFWTSIIATIRSATNQLTKLGLILEEKVTAPSLLKSDNRVEFGLGFSDELLRTSLMVVRELMKPSWCPSPNADSLLRATQGVQRELNSDCNLRDLNIIYNLMRTASKSNREDKVELPGWEPEDWLKPGR